MQKFVCYLAQKPWRTIHVPSRRREITAFASSCDMRYRGFSTVIISTSFIVSAECALPTNASLFTISARILANAPPPHDTPALALFAQRTRIPTSARSIGFCVIWVCISSSSSSNTEYILWCFTFYRACGARGFLILVLPAVARFLCASISIRFSQLRMCLEALVSCVFYLVLSPPQVHKSP